MKPYKIFTKRRFLFVAIGSLSGGAHAVTEINTDTVIDASSPEREEYLVNNGATLTSNGAITGTITASSFNGIRDFAHLIINSSRVEGDVRTTLDSTANISGTTVTGNVNLSGVNSSIRDSDVAGFLMFVGKRGESRTAIAENVRAGYMSAQDGSWEIISSKISNTARRGLNLIRANASLFGSSVHGSDNALLMVTAVLPAPNNRVYELSASDTAFSSETGAVFKVGTTDYSGGGYSLYSNALITLSANSSAASGSGELLNVEYYSGATLTLDGSTASGNVRTDETSTAEIILQNGSQLSGGIFGVNRVALDDSSVWNVTADSDVENLAMNSGTVRFSPSSGGGFRTLSLGTLEGGGSFYMNTDAAGMQGDFIDVAGSASGSYLLHVANTGAEPAQTEDALRLVRTGGGDAGFTLNGGRVDIGAWQYTLVRNGNEWDLVQAGTGPGPNPGPEPDPEPGPEPEPGPSTSASTDAVLSMASAPRFMFYGELSGLSNRAQSLRGGHQSGVWGTYLHNGDRVKGAWQSAYRLEQDGLMLGADTARDNAYGSLVTGAFVSSSSGRVKHARGGKSRIDAWGGGLYATQRSDTGWYADAVLKLNRFENSLSARMTDGADVSGSWNTWGYGASLEAGRELQYSGGLSLTPYVSLTGYQNQSKRVELSNGMTARTGSGRSVRAEAGARAAATLSAGGVPVRPYLRAALTQELAKGGTVRINYRYDFADDFAGSGARAGAGVSVSVTPAATLWLDAGWARGERHESPVSGSAGLRFTF